MEKEQMRLKQNLAKLLPPSLYNVCEKFLDTYPEISEMRLRRGKSTVFTLRERNVESSYVCDDALMDRCLSLWIGTERYKQAECLTNGVIRLPHGFRVGVVGTALLDKGKIVGIYNVSALNLRLPRPFYGSSRPLYDYITALPHPCRSILLLGPPCSGKTTVLRDFAHLLSTAPVSERVCIVDPSQELTAFSDPRSLHLDTFIGYPTPLGIELSTRYFNPRYVICDEIGTADELTAIRNSTHTGVPIIASAHASSLFEAIQRPILRSLLEENVFFSAVTLTLNDKGINFRFYSRKEVDAALCHQSSLLL